MVFYAGVVICLNLIGCKVYTNQVEYKNEKTCSKYMQKLETQFEKIKFDWKSKDHQWYVNGGCMQSEKPSDNIKADLLITYGPNEKVDI